MLMNQFAQRQQSNAYARAFVAAMAADRAVFAATVPFMVLVAKALGSKAKTIDGAKNYLKLQTGLLPATFYKQQ